MARPTATKQGCGGSCTPPTAPVRRYSTRPLRRSSPSFPIAFAVLVFATQNLLVSLYAIVGIAFVVASVLGAAEWVYGWGLGVIEALAGVLVIGFSVDYAIHLCHMYVEADKVGFTDNLERFVYSITKMGGTVVGGAVTTFGAAAFMLPCQLTFFYKLGLLIFTTILCSFCFSFGFVMPLLAAAGPSGDRCGFRFHVPARVAAAPAGTPSPQLIYPINVGAGGAVPVDPAADELPAPLTVYPPSPLIVTTPLRRVYKKCRRYT